MFLIDTIVRDRHKFARRVSVCFVN